jgi:hypothetical protein
MKKIPGGDVLVLEGTHETTEENWLPLVTGISPRRPYFFVMSPGVGHKYVSVHIFDHPDVRSIFFKIPMWLIDTTKLAGLNCGWKNIGWLWFLILDCTQQFSEWIWLIVGLSWVMQWLEDQLLQQWGIRYAHSKIC